MLISTTTVTITRPNGGDSDPYVQTPSGATTIAAATPAHISSPAGSDARVGGDQEIVDAVLFVAATVPLDRTMVVADDTTGETYQITWTRLRTGLGLAHRKAGLVAVKGGSNG